MLDILIKGGLVIDGTGNEPARADVGIAGGRIAGVGRLEGAEATLVIDAKDMAVTPGFIDMHSHSDLTLTTHPQASSSLLQGITTEVAGSCGWSLAPLKGDTATSVLSHLCQGLCGSVPPEVAVDPDGGREPAWHSFGEYLDYLRSQGIGVNLYPIVGQSLLRAHVVGTERRKATPGEMRAMKALLEASMEEGARGLSTGRSYAPGAHASTEEIIELCRIVAARDGLYTSHIKDEAAGLPGAVEEVIRIGRETGARVEVSHHKAIGLANFGKVHETLAMLDEARQDGVDATCDVYPYAFAQVFSLAGEIPGLSSTAGKDEARELLAKPEFREKVVTEVMRETERGGHAPGFLARPDHYVVLAAGRDPSLEGRTLGEVLEAGAAASPLDAAEVRSRVVRGLDVLIEQDLVVNIAAVMSEDDVRAVLGHPETLVGTDAFCLDHPLGERTPIHPRHYGTFPRVLGHYGREQALFSLAEAVRKITGLAARKLRLHDRGLLARGMWADIVVFDPATIIDKAAGKTPYEPPAGIRHVVVNGRLAVADGKVLGEKAGMVLSR